MLKDVSHAIQLEGTYKIPKEDIILIALNICGIKTEDTNEKRVRFRFRLKDTEEMFYLAICVNTGDSPFVLRENKIYLNGEEIGTVFERELDTCDSTYFRRNKTAMTLNSNSRSKCRGCKFCGTYSQEAEDIHNLVTEERLSEYIDKLLATEKMADLSSIVDIGICTGCFPGESYALDHIIMVRKVLAKYGFKGMIKYIGSQIRSEASINQLKAEVSPFSLYFTAECFERRHELLNPIKGSLTLSEIRDILTMSKNAGFNTTFLYILGLDSLKTIGETFEMFLPALTRFPIINLFQNYLSDQENIRIPEAKKIDYYLKARLNIEKIFLPTAIRPSPWEDYRSLWYFKFGNESINDYRI